MKRLLLALLLSSCAQVSPQLGQAVPGEPAFTSRADLKLEINGNKFDGLGAWKLTDAVSVKVSGPIKFDRLEISSFARNDVIQGAPNPFTYEYHPSPTELAGACPLYVEAYDKRNLSAWGMLAFRKDESVPIHSFMNGEGMTFAGFAVGQSKAGLEQTLEFKQQVQFEAEPGCRMTTKDNKAFSFAPNAGFCRATFAYRLDQQTYYARLLFLAYTKTLFRD